MAGNGASRVFLVAGAFGKPLAGGVGGRLGDGRLSAFGLSLSGTGSAVTRPARRVGLFRFDHYREAWRIVKRYGKFTFDPLVASRQKPITGER